MTMANDTVDSTRRIRITEPKQAIIGVVLITTIAFGMKYLLFDSGTEINPKDTTTTGSDKPVVQIEGNAYTITRASWATDDENAKGTVTPAGGLDAKLEPTEAVDPIEARRMKEAAERWQGLDIAIRRE